MKIGFIGTGIMGAPMAGQLLNAGHDVHAYTILVNNRTYGDSRVRAPKSQLGYLPVYPAKNAGTLHLE